MSDYSEYTKARDIAQKRLKRMEASGIRVDYKIPTVKEIKAGKANLAESFSMLSSFLSSSMNLSSMRESSRIHYTPEEAAARKREYQRQYRRLRTARKYEREEYPRKYQGYVKGVKTLATKLKEKFGIDIDISPKQLPAFFAYADYRLSQGSVGQKYIFDMVVLDFVKYLKKGYSSSDILNDFELFVADQSNISVRADMMKGYSTSEFNKFWDRFMDSKDISSDVLFD